MIRILLLRLIEVQEVEKSDQEKRVNPGFEIDRIKMIWRKSDYGLDV